jgi:hypothetical protein
MLHVIRWLLPEYFDWEDRITINSEARKRTETGKNLSMPETYNITEVSTWSADAAGTGTDYLKLVNASVSYLPGKKVCSIGLLYRLNVKLIDGIFAPLTLITFLHTLANTDAALQQISGMVRSMSLQTREAELQLVKEYVESNTEAAAAVEVVDAESCHTCSTQDESGVRSSIEARIASESESTSIMVTDEVRALT